MASRTHYEVLGVQPSADADLIEKAYRRRVRRVHPDVSDAPDSLEQFYAIQRAYDVLRDTERRRQYDRQLAAPPPPPPTPPIPPASSVASAAASGGPQWWDPAHNPLLRKRLLKSRRKKWLARLETFLLVVNLLLGIALIFEFAVMRRPRPGGAPALPIDTTHPQPQPAPEAVGDPQWPPPGVETDGLLPEGLKFEWDGRPLTAPALPPAE